MFESVDKYNKVTEKLLNKYHKMFESVDKYNKVYVHLFINNKIPPVAEKVSDELAMLRKQDIIEEVRDEPITHLL